MTIAQLSNQKWREKVLEDNTKQNTFLKIKFKKKDKPGLLASAYKVKAGKSTILTLKEQQWQARWDANSQFFLTHQRAQVTGNFKLKI